MCIRDSTCTGTFLHVSAYDGKNIVTFLLIVVSWTGLFFVDDTGKHTCPGCGKRYRWASGLSRHRAMSSCCREHVCPYCGHRTTKASGLFVHVMSVHPEQLKNRLAYSK